MTGKEQDAETGLDYFGARHYKPALARWSSVDPLAEKHGICQNVFSFGVFFRSLSINASPYTRDPNASTLVGR